MEDETAYAGAPCPPRQILGHPAGIFVLFGAEMWERFCFYGMRTLLVLYLTKGFLGYDDDHAYNVSGSYMSLVYLTPILGGLLADRILGYRRAIMLGGAFMAVGEFCLLFGLAWTLYGGMALMIVGNGFFKPNMSTLVGKLYAPGDPRRDGGFTIFYMGVNVGAFLATGICGWAGETIDWRLGFGLAGVGMLAGLAIFGCGLGLLQGQGLPPSEGAFRRRFPLVVAGAVAAVPLVSVLLEYPGITTGLFLLTSAAVVVVLLGTALREATVRRQQMFVLLILLVFHCAFWGIYEQASTSLNLYVDRNVDREIDTPFGSWVFPTTWNQAFNPLYIILLSPFFAALWPFLDRRRLDPSIPNKFSLALVQIGLGYGVLVLAAHFLSRAGLVPLSALALAFLLHTTGELCISPIGFSMVTKLAPERMSAMVMGAWFMSISGGHQAAKEIARLTGAAGGEGGKGLPPTESLPIYTDVYLQVSIAACVAAGLLFVLSPTLKRWLHGVK